MCVQVEETPCHISQQRLLEGEGEARRSFQQIVQAAVQSLHYQHWQCRSLQETQPQELHNVWVP